MVNFGRIMVELTADEEQTGMYGSITIEQRVLRLASRKLVLSVLAASFWQVDVKTED